MEKQFLRKFIIYKVILALFLGQFMTLNVSYALVPLAAAPVAASVIADAIIANASRRAAITVAEKIWVTNKVNALVGTAVGTTTTTNSAGVLAGIAATLGITLSLKSSSNDTELKFKPTGTDLITQFMTDTNRPANSPQTSLELGKPVWQSFNTAPSTSYPIFSDPYSVIVFVLQTQFPSSIRPYTVQNCNYTNANKTYTCNVLDKNSTPIGDVSVILKPSYTSPVDCPIGVGYNGTSCMASEPIEYAQPQTTTQTTPNIDTDSLPDLMPQQAKDQPISPQTLADITNEIYDRITQEPNIPFPPFSPVNPVVQTDVKATPKMQDFVQPTPTSQQYAPSPLAAPDSTTGQPTLDVTPTAPTQQETPPPTIGQPGLERTPTIDMILSPITNLMPGLRNFSMPTYTTQCPTLNINFTFMGKQFSAAPTYHCQIVAEHRSSIRAASIGFATILVLFILLGAR